jgi:hypothetical protein
MYLGVKSMSIIDKTIFKLILLLLLACANTSLQGQDSKGLNENRHRIGFIMGYGDQGIGQLFRLDVGYRYEVYFYQFQYYYSIKSRQKWSFELLLQPQFNTTKIPQVDDLSAEVYGYEFGLNVGILVRRNIFNDHIGVYGLISLGPHYISNAPQRQSKGFIFSDNVMGGVHVRIAKDTYLDLRGGLRHISNAGLSRPNGGMNTIVLSAGVMIALK